ncbi:hypothetical protein JB92DRAFT_2888427 [Gautieria morchelliformis]|nr:hypothetical protein JB92DRAFT_2888427 [Gautieria morchelliformis]
MTTLGLPYFFEDTTGLPCGPTDFLDIYDRPPFLRLSTSNTHAQPRNAKSHAVSDDDKGQTLKIFELKARTLTSSRTRREDGPPSAVISLDAGRGLLGSVKFRGGTGVALARWLKKPTTFGSTLTRQFKASDGMYYQWSFRRIQEHEWACVQLGTNLLAAHYDLKPPTEPIYQTSGNVLTVHENCVHLAVELLASLTIMRHIRSQS